MIYSNVPQRPYGFHYWMQHPPDEKPAHPPLPPPVFWTNLGPCHRDHLSGGCWKYYDRDNDFAFIWDWLNGTAAQ